MELHTDLRVCVAYCAFATGEEFLAQSDPTDHALAAIASILDHSGEHPDSKNQDSKAHDSTSDGSEAEEAEVQKSEAAPEAEPTPAAEPISPVQQTIDIDNYSKLGPGPLDAIRFRWTARRDDAGQYFVDETIGPNSRPLVLGPMRREDVVDFIDNRERDSRLRFEKLKREMTIGRHAPDDDSER